MSSTYSSTKYHRDGTVTLWNVYSQQWERHEAAALVEQCERPSGNLLLPTLSSQERARCKRMAATIDWAKPKLGDSNGIDGKMEWRVHIRNDNG